MVDGIGKLCGPEFRRSSPTIFWNLVLYFQSFELPFVFLLIESAPEQWLTTWQQHLAGGQ